VLRRAARGSPWNSEELIREELFSAERLEQHAESLAVAQRVTDSPASAYPLSRRLRDNARVLLRAYHTIAGVIDQGHPITPAAEWLVDNFHVVEDQIREIREDLPAGYYRQLPKLADGPLAGYPLQDFESTEGGGHTHIWRDLIAGNPAVASDNAIATTGDNLPQAQQYNAMDSALKVAHGYAHSSYIRGSIGQPHFSFHDPFVFLLHSNVDKIWAMWQVAFSITLNTTSTSPRRASLDL
jgi:hypothetical protein